jgi:hypothetical protein
MNLDYNRLMKVALAGAATAVFADVLRSQYGDEFSGLLGELQQFVANILNQNNTPSNTGGTTL